jgi:hypothetical protein
MPFCRDATQTFFEQGTCFDRPAKEESVIVGCVCAQQDLFLRHVLAGGLPRVERSNSVVWQIFSCECGILV